MVYFVYERKIKGADSAPLTGTARGANMAEKKKEKRIRSLYIDSEKDDQLSKIAKQSGTSLSNAATKILNDKLDELNDRESILPTIIVFSNFKGGVAKTTSVKEVGYNLSKRGYKVLLIDLDGQSNLSSSFEVYDPKELDGYISDVILADGNGKRRKLSDVIISTDYENLDLAPANLSFASADNKIRSQEGGAIDRRLLYAIQDLTTEAAYDYIIIDCPPTTDSVVQNAIMALQAGNSRSMIIVPINSDTQAIDGLDRTAELVDTVCLDNRLSKPQVIALWTNARTNEVLYQVTKADFENTHDNFPQFETVITASTKVGQARILQKTATEHARGEKVAVCYKNVTDEIVKLTAAQI